MSKNVVSFFSGVISTVVAMLIYSYLGAIIGGNDPQLNELISLQKEEIQIARDIIAKKDNLTESDNRVLSILSKMEETNNQIENLSSDLLTNESSDELINKSKPKCVKLNESLEVSKYVTVSITAERTDEKTGRKEYFLQANHAASWRPTSYSWLSRENGEKVRITFLHKKNGEFCFKAISLE